MDTTETPVSTPARTEYHAVAPGAPDAGFDARWAAWLQRGRVHDRRGRQRLLLSGGMLAMAAVGAAIIYALVQS